VQDEVNQEESERKRKLIPQVRWCKSKKRW